MRIGFVGQGFIGKHMADDFSERGYAVVRYALEEPYRHNKEAIAGCDVVFIAVPTPTTPAGFDSSALETVLPLVGVGKVAVIKSTVLPGTTRRLARTFLDRLVVHMPEFLREKSAASDTRKPKRTIIGLPNTTDEYKAAAATLLGIVPKADYECVCSAEEAELIKYGGNCFLAMKVIYMNLIYDLALTAGASYDIVASAMAHDERIGSSHMKVVDPSSHPGALAGRGAGGHCFPKDLAALREVYETMVVSDDVGVQLLRALEEKNCSLLRDSEKDRSLLEGIYGHS